MTRARAGVAEMRVARPITARPRDRIQRRMTRLHGSGAGGISSRRLGGAKDWFYNDFIRPAREKASRPTCERAFMTPGPLPQVRLKIERRSSHPWVFQKMVEK